jgi:hypothetical protein
MIRKALILLRRLGWCQLTNSLTLISSSYPGSTVLTLGIVKTCFRLAPRYGIKVVLLPTKKITGYVTGDFLCTLVCRAGFEPAKAVGRQIYSLL